MRHLIPQETLNFSEPDFIPSSESGNINTSPIRIDAGVKLMHMNEVCCCRVKCQAHY